MHVLNVNYIRNLFTLVLPLLRIKIISGQKCNVLTFKHPLMFVTCIWWYERFLYSVLALRKRTLKEFIKQWLSMHSSLFPLWLISCSPFHVNQICEWSLSAHVNRATWGLCLCFFPLFAWLLLEQFSLTPLFLSFSKIPRCLLIHMSISILQLFILTHDCDSGECC